MGFAILPPATTYDRVWRAKAEVMPWDEGPYRCIMNRPAPIDLFTDGATANRLNQFLSDYYEKNYKNHLDEMIIENFSYA